MGVKEKQTSKGAGKWSLDPRRKDGTINRRGKARKDGGLSQTNVELRCQ